MESHYVAQAGVYFFLITIYYSDNLLERKSRIIPDLESLGFVHTTSGKKKKWPGSLHQRKI